MVRLRCACALKLGYRLTFERCEDRRPLNSDAVLLLLIVPVGDTASGTVSDAVVSADVEATAPRGRSVVVRVGLPAGPSAYLADVVYAGSTNVAAEGQPAGPGVEQRRVSKKT